MATQFKEITIEQTETLALYVFPCAQCGIIFAVPQDWIDNRRADGGAIHCPNGHRLSYHPCEADNLRNELAGERRRTEAALREVERERANVAWERKRHAATKGQLTKTQRRVEAGVCIHCHRSFVQLSRHMQTKHAAVLGAEADV